MNEQDRGYAPQRILQTRGILSLRKENLVINLVSRSGKCKKTL
jgi:hypothetical protein